jgi:hypothetical protein
MQLHEYRPLDKERREIRLLHLEAVVSGSSYGYDSECVLGRLECRYLQGGGTEGETEDDAGQYLALSYVWGEPHYTSAVILDDGTYVPITTNLLIAIQHIFENGFAPVGGTPARYDPEINTM